MMELGNMAFGHSRGAWPIPREPQYEDAIVNALEPLGEFNAWENHIGSACEVHPYWWGEEDAPEANRPNLHHFASGLEVRWYKYPLRDSYASREVSPEEWAAIMAECRASIVSDLAKSA